MTGLTTSDGAISREGLTLKAYDYLTSHHRERVLLFVVVVALMIVLVQLFVPAGVSGG